MNGSQLTAQGKSMLKGVKMVSKIETKLIDE